MSAKPHNYFISVCLRCQHEPQLNTRICLICANLSHCQHVRAGITASISQFGLSVIWFRRSRLLFYSPPYSFPSHLFMQHRVVCSPMLCSSLPCRLRFCTCFLLVPLWAGINHAHSSSDLLQSGRGEDSGWTVVSNHFFFLAPLL